MCGEDAAEAARRGVDAIMVSNHGGRQLDGTFGTIEVLEECVEAVREAERQMGPLGGPLGSKTNGANGANGANDANGADSGDGTRGGRCGRTRCEVYLDGGVRRGRDVFKALALGATAVFVGRPVLYVTDYKERGDDR